MEAKTCTNSRDQKVKRIIDSWRKVTSSNQESRLTDEEKAHFERARLVEEQTKKSGFVLGGSIRNE